MLEDAHSVARFSRCKLGNRLPARGRPESYFSIEGCRFPVLCSLTPNCCDRPDSRSYFLRRDQEICFEEKLDMQSLFKWVHLSALLMIVACLVETRVSGDAPTGNSRGKVIWQYDTGG